MVDEREPGADGIAGGEPREPREPETAAPAGEPEFGSSEWLLQQLTGGRHITRPAPTDTHAGTGPAEHAAVPAADAGEDGEPGEPSDPVDDGRPPATAPIEPQFPVTPDSFDFFLLPPSIPDDGPEAADEPRDAPTTVFPILPPLEPGAGSVVPGADHAPADAEPASFAWNLTPGVGSDPLVEEQEASGRPPFDLLVPGADADAGAPPAESAPPAAPTTDAEPAPRVEPPSFAGSLRMPEPPVWPVVIPAALTPEAVAQPEPVVAPEPEPEREPEPEPEPEDVPAPQGHGLAALLGLLAEDDSESPTSRSVIGDTTGIVPLPPGWTPNAPQATPPAAPVPPAEAVPPAFAAPTPPAPPLLPPPDAAALYEPVPAADPSDTPTMRLDAAAMAALLKARPGDPDPDAAATPAQSAATPAPSPEPVADPAAPPLPFVALTPSVPGVPPVEEATFLLGALPSPATQPLDAESIGEASEPTAEPEIFDEPAMTAEREPNGTAEPEQEAEDEDEEDPFAALFGPVLIPDDDEEPDQPATPAEPFAAAGWDAPRTPLPDEVQPDVEQPHVVQSPVVQSPVAEPPTQVLPRAAGPSADTVLFPDLAMTTAAAPSPVADTATTVFPAAAIPVPTTTQTTSETGTSGAGGSGAGREGARIDPRLFWVLGGLAVLLVLIGLFALGTRLPSLFAASTPVPSAPATSAPPSAKATPSATPVPTVQPKPAAAVGPGEHPWNALGGGECIQPYTNPWAQTFTVVDCATPHAAQLVYTNVLSADPAAPYPGADALGQQINGLCTASGVIDLGAAAAYPNLQVQGTFPATEQQWKDGQRSYYCFASRAGGEPLTSSVAGPGPTG